MGLGFLPFSHVILGRDYWTQFFLIFSLSTLNRRLKRLGIKRRDHSVTFGEIAHAVAQERRGPGTNSGIRFMHLAIRSRHGLHVSQ